MNMTLTPSYTKRYRVFFSSTFLDNQEIRALLIKKLNYARLFYTAMETFIGEVDVTLKTKLKKEIDKSDIYILLVKYYEGGGVIQGNVAATQFEYRYARKQNKLILPYLKDNGSYNNFGDNCTTSFKQEVSEHYKYSRLEDDPEAATTKIFCDILHHVSFNDSLSCWIKSDFNKHDITYKIFGKMRALSQSINETNSKFRMYMDKLDLPDYGKQDLIGRLVDSGVMKAEKNRAYQYIKPKFRPGIVSPDEDVSYDTEYYVDRFDRYVSGVIYDRKLNLYWYYLKNRSFSFTEAMEFCQDMPEVSDGACGCTWKLPTIEQLMSLMTVERQEHGFIDDIFGTENVHWFWSGTQASEGSDAYYIETIDRKIHADSTGETDVHKKAVIVCTGDRPFTKEPALDHIDIDTPLPDVSILKETKGNTLYQLYFSQNLYTLLEEFVHLFEKHMYYITCVNSIGARSCSMRESIETEIRASDIYCVYIDGNVSDDVRKQIRLEVKLASNHSIPILLFMQTDNAIDLSGFGLAGYGDHNLHTHVRPGERLEYSVLAAIHNTLPSVCGWIQKADYDAIKSIISGINRMEEKLLEGQLYIRKYLDHCSARGLEEALVNNQILIRNTNAGSSIRFVSKSNPVTMFLKNEFNSKDSILLETFPDRFAEIDNGSGIYRDRYLNIYWNTNVVKQKTFDEAIAYAKSFSHDKIQGWRLPEINELITLITPTFGTRKYMDEDIFPVGRWFWSNTVTDDGNTAYYINYHFFNGAVDLEKTYMTEDIRKKSVLLVSNEG